jgi:hypothetical protein
LLGEDGSRDPAGIPGNEIIYPGYLQDPGYCFFALSETGNLKMMFNYENEIRRK